MKATGMPELDPLIKRRVPQGLGAVKIEGDWQLTTDNGQLTTDNGQIPHGV